MNSLPPEFQSDIPSHLLENATPQDKWIMENISILNQKTNWLTEMRRYDSERLHEMDGISKETLEQTKKTNGRVNKLEERNEIAEQAIKEFKEIEPDLMFLINAKKVIMNPWTFRLIVLAGVGAFYLVFKTAWGETVFRALFGV